ncbi:cytochrome c [Pusillimonas sp. CC-YST705]|uniref:Cytochrome c n=1 Tax=Mesopusillimonas faecipullorum TaxID=2755040 RepID=A0ABS8CCW4_9BURK|nr:cytochrome c [Mesopusillimonas faecipullorum]MCB5363870.1 cytochrome c [Mesopusillimonas faecipullorum]
MKRRGLRNVLVLILIVLVLLALAVLFGLFRTSSVSPDVKQALTEAQKQELLPRGRELALAGDCFGCHSKTEGPKAAGGVPIATPFGTLHSTNITPDPTYGIGQYTREDFHRVLRDGIAPGNRNLYPGMPFVFTHVTRTEDIDALYAYMMSLPPIAEPNVPNTGVFTLPVRPFMNFWTLINFPKRQPPTREGASEQWLRGAYLVEGLGHCASCHTPRNLTMGVSFDKHFQGGDIVDGLVVPNITAETLAQRGFDAASLSQYLRTGMSAQGTAFGGMYTVVHFSTSEMEPADIDAIATYLMTDENGQLLTPPPGPAPLAQASQPLLQPGRYHYASACAGCHGAQGEGIPNVAPPMDGNTAVMMSNPSNLITVILQGIDTQTFTGNQRMYAMPGFADRMNNEDIALLASWMRAQWGGQEEAVTAAQVQAIRAKQ